MGPLTVALPLPGAAQTARSGPEREVLSIVDSLFAAMKRRDPVAARQVMVPGAVFYSMLDDGVPSQPRVQADSTFVRSLASGTGMLLERYWSPTISISGGVAQVWTPYDLHINGTFSHCGVDNFSLLRTPEGWRLAAISYTVQRKGCAPSPLGPPQ
jgi:hypothetical protein